jgi:hypothetical protein
LTAVRVSVKLFPKLHRSDLDLEEETRNGPRWGLSESGSVYIQLCSTPPSWLQFSLHLGVSHQFSSVFFVCLLETFLAFFISLGI